MIAFKLFHILWNAIFFEYCSNWSFVRKTYGDARSKMGKVSNLVNGPVPCCHWMYPPVPGRILGKSTFSCNVQWCMQICHKPFSHHVRAIWKCSFTIFLLQMQIWNGCNVLNIAGNPIKDINVNLSFLSSWWKVVEYTPPGLENFFTSFLSWVSKVAEYMPP